MRLTEEALVKALLPLTKLQEETNQSLRTIQTRLNALSSRLEDQQQGSVSSWPLFVLIAAFVMQVFVQWLFR